MCKSVENKRWLREPRRHTLFVDGRGRVFGCGSSKRGQLGLEEKVLHFNPKHVSSLPGEIVSLAAGQHFSLALSKDGRVHGFGDNKYGEILGYGEDQDGTCELKLGLSSPGKKICCGWTHGLVLLQDSTVRSWGRNDYSQLGGCESRVFQARDIDSGSEHCLAVSAEDGKLYSWGWNEHGNCGTGNLENVTQPTLVNFGTTYSEVLCFCSASGHNFAYLNLKE